MQSRSTFDYARDDSHIYQNLTLYNNTDGTVRASYDQTFDTPILAKSGDWDVMIERFFIPAQSVPIFIFPNPNASPVPTPYVVTLTYGGTDYATNVQYISYSSFATTSDSYYWVYGYQEFINMINAAYQTCYLALIAAHPGVANGAPYLTYEPGTELISLNAGPEYLSANGSATATVTIWMNQVFDFFQNLVNVFHGYLTAGVSNPKAFQVIVQNTGNNSITLNGPYGYGGAGYKMTQQYSSLFNWNSFRSIVFETNGLPVVPELLRPNTAVGDQNATLNGRTILTDFFPDVSRGTEVRGYQQYYANGNHRVINLRGSDPLKRLSLNIYWSDVGGGTTTPLLLSPKDSCNIKILYRRKDYRGPN